MREDSATIVRKQRRPLRADVRTQRGRKTNRTGARLLGPELLEIGATGTRGGGGLVRRRWGCRRRVAQEDAHLDTAIEFLEHPGDSLPMLVQMAWRSRGAVKYWAKSRRRDGDPRIHDRLQHRVVGLPLVQRRRRRLTLDGTDDRRQLATGDGTHRLVR